MDEVARAAVAEEYRLKLRELFDTLDQNHNGYLVRGDVAFECSRERPSGLV